MSFYDEYLKYKNFKFDDFLRNVSDENIFQIINKDKLSILDFFTLISPKVEKFIEQIAVRAKQLTLQHFGKVIFLCTPMYLANYCINQCVY